MYYLEGKIRPVKHLSGRVLLGIATAGVIGITALATFGGNGGLKRVFVHAAPIPTPGPSISVEPLWPTNNAAVNGTVNLRFTVHGLSPDQYEPFWAVDNGTWNRMATDPNNAAIATDPINVSGWNWKKDGTYTITFTALIKGSWQPVQSNVTMKVGTATAATPTAPSATSTTSSPASTAPTQSASSATPVAAAPVSSNLFSNASMDAVRQALALARSDPANASRLQRLAAQPMAEWFGNWNSNVTADVNNYVSAAAAVNQVPVLVTYNIPQRDCGGYSAGGAGDGQGYLNWVRNVSQGIAGRRAIVIVEPDALANMDCLPSGDQQTRLSLLSQAVSILNNGNGTQIYLDAGHPNWIGAATMANRLKAANIDQADGFSLNVSNFISTADNIAFGSQISKLVNNKHFVIDTSRNGNGATSDGQWCNPLGRAVGQTPTLQTGNPLVDAYLWIKTPGASDGACGASVSGTSAPGAGAWWPQYALQLLQNANW